MSVRPIPLANHIHGELRSFRLGVTILVSLVISIIFTGWVLSARSRSDQRILGALSPYLATLVESQDRPEILRVLQSVAGNRENALVLVHDGLILASTRNVSEMDQAFVPPHSQIALGGSGFTSDQIISRAQVSAPGHPSTRTAIYSFTPLRSTLVAIPPVIFVALLLGLIISHVSMLKMRSAIHSALRPVNQLHHEIQHLTNAQVPSSDPLAIEELEAIRRTISTTKLDLANITERLAEERARTLSAKSYKQLIHDLHNPVAALRQWVCLLTDSTSQDDVRQEAAASVPRIADQILRQVGAAKRHLENEPAALRESDLRACIKASLDQVRIHSKGASTERLSLTLPPYPVTAAHDPDLLQRAILNLLENGIEASRMKVVLSLESTANHAIIRVSDDGDGMNESDLSLYIQGQGRSHRANREALGLASTSHIVRTHGGKLIYRKNPWGGASFEIRLETAG